MYEKTTHPIDIECQRAIEKNLFPRNQLRKDLAGSRYVSTPRTPKQTERKPDGKKDIHR